MTNSNSLPALLDQAAWIQGLAQRMVRDPNLADDLAQDAIEAGLKGTTDQIRNPRAWLAGAVRNLHLEELRKRKVRRERPQSDELSGAEASAGELAERLEIQRKVSQAVLDLPERYSSLVILRFYEKRPVRAIAAELGLGRREVENRLTQALQLLRGSLQKRLGANWAALFLPFSVPTHWGASVTASVLHAPPAFLLSLLLSLAALFGVGISLWPGLPTSRRPLDAHLAGISADSHANADSGLLPSPSASAEVERTAINPPLSSNPHATEMNQLRTLLTASLSLALAAPSVGQMVGGQWDLHRQLDGQAAGDEFGYEVVGVGDLDQDGSDDLLVSAWFASPGGLNRAGSVMAYSGATGLEMYRWDGTVSNQFHGQSIDRAGDVNGDGYPDVIIGATGARPGGFNRAGSAFVYSGRDGTLIHRFDGQSAFQQHGWVAGAGDVDGDGFHDLLVGAELASPGGLNGAGSAYLYSGRTGQVIWTFHGTEEGGHFGNFLAGAGDIDGDGSADLLIAGMDEDALGLTNAGVVYLYSGATGALLQKIDGSFANGQLGIGLAGLGDLNGDGKGEYAVGAPGYSGPYQGIVDVYSGLNAAPILQLQGEAVGDRFGFSVANAGDVDGDGLSDILVGAPNAAPGNSVDAGSTYLYSGKNGELLRRFDGVNPGDRFGYSAAGAGDIDADGHDEVIIGAPFADPAGQTSAGSVYIYSLAPYLSLSSNSLSVTAGNTVDIELAFPIGEAGERYAVLASMSGPGPVMFGGLEIPLTQDLMLGLFANRNAPAALQGELGNLDSNAKATATLTAGPSMVPAIGHTIYIAAITYDISPLTGRMSSVVRQLPITP
jgi:RNA polymerase sigma factor (sigma-70 family)